MSIERETDKEDIYTTEYCLCYIFRCIQLLPTPQPVACQAPLSMGFSRQEYWSGLPFPSPRDLPDPGIEPRSSTLQADSFLTMSYEGSPNIILGVSVMVFLNEINMVAQW